MKLVDPNKSWFVIRCFAGEEAASALELHKLGFDAYCPKMRKQTVHHRTKAVLIKEEPLLTGYLFAAQPRRVGDEERIDFATMQRKPEKHESKKLFRAVLRSKKDGEFLPLLGKLVEGFQIAEMNMAFDDTDAAKKHRGETREAELRELRECFPVGATVFAEGIFESLPGVITKHLKTGRVKIDYQSITVEADMEKLKPAA